MSDRSCRWGLLAMSCLLLGCGPSQCSSDMSVENPRQLEIAAPKADKVFFDLLGLGAAVDLSSPGTPVQSDLSSSAWADSLDSSLWTVFEETAFALLERTSDSESADYVVRVIAQPVVHFSEPEALTIAALVFLVRRDEAPWEYLTHSLVAGKGAGKIARLIYGTTLQVLRIHSAE